jgi:chromosome segregation ATPase
MGNVKQPSLLGENSPVNTKEEFEKAKLDFKNSIELLVSKVGHLIEKNAKKEKENEKLNETVRELNLKLQELKLEINKLNSDIVLKEKEISNFKNQILGLKAGKSATDDKEKVKSRIKELISRIDTHLDSYEEQDEEQ